MKDKGMTLAVALNLNALLVSEIAQVKPRNVLQNVITRVSNALYL